MHVRSCCAFLDAATCSLTDSAESFFEQPYRGKWAHPLLPTPLWSRDSADLEDRKGLCLMRNRCMFALVAFFPAMNLLSRRTPRSHRGVATESPCNAFCIRKHRSEMNRALGPTPRRVCDSAVWRRTREAFFSKIDARSLLLRLSRRCYMFLGGLRGIVFRTTLTRKMGTSPIGIKKLKAH